jgi:hypothetical protein
VHAHRTIYEVHEATTSPFAKEALERIAAIETQINGRSPRIAWPYRQQEAVPLLAGLKDFLDQALTEISGFKNRRGAGRLLRFSWICGLVCVSKGANLT